MGGETGALAEPSPPTAPRAGEASLSPGPSDGSEGKMAGVSRAGRTEWRAAGPLLSSRSFRPGQWPGGWEREFSPRKMGTALQFCPRTQPGASTVWTTGQNGARAVLCHMLSAQPGHPPDSTPCGPPRPALWSLQVSKFTTRSWTLSGPNPVPSLGSVAPLWSSLPGPLWLTILPGPAAPQKRPQSFRLFLMMTSVTASNTNCTFLVSVAHVKCV